MQMVQKDVIFKCYRTMFASPLLSFIAIATVQVASENNFCLTDAIIITFLSTEDPYVCSLVDPGTMLLQ